MIKREIHIFLTAIMFYTRIPCPAWVGHNPAYISASTRYFPVIGWIVGGVYAGVIILLSYLLSVNVSVVAGIIVSILLTGAFHEDGFADVCDGFGGGWSKDKILAIMKDSRLGTYGVTGLVLILVLKVFVTVDLLTSVGNKLTFMLLIVTSHTASRMMTIIVIFLEPYAKDEKEESKAKPVASGISLKSTAVACLFTLLPLGLFVAQTGLIYAVVVLPMILLTIYLMIYFEKWLGGYTGDCLGAVQQMNEVVFLLSVSVVWTFI